MGDVAWLFGFKPSSPTSPTGFSSTYGSVGESSCTGDTVWRLRSRLGICADCERECIVPFSGVVGVYAGLDPTGASLLGEEERLCVWE
jgi:hypothetical protein